MHDQAILTSQIKLIKDFGAEMSFGYIILSQVVSLFLIEKFNLF